MNNAMTELQAALRAAGHGADEAHNTPVDVLNVFLNDEGRVPDATVVYDPVDPAEGGRFVWGHRWEHSIETAKGTGAAVEAIVGSIEATPKETP